MRFGYFDPLMRPDHQGPYHELMSAMREQASACDQAGFHTFWLGEHHLGPEGMDRLPNPILVGADLAARTKQIRVGQACNCLPFWHPLRLAEDIALLDQLTQGRVDVAIGKGTKPRETAQWHAKSDSRKGPEAHELFAETFDIMKKAWTQEFFSHQGPNYTLPRPGTPWSHPMSPPDSRWVKDGLITKLHLTPQTYQKPYPPLWMVSDSPLSLQFAAENALKAIVWQPPIPGLKEKFEYYREKRSAYEGKPYGLGDGMAVMRTAYVAPTMKEAREDAERGVMHIYKWIHPPRRGLGVFMNPGENVPEYDALTWEFLFERNLLVGTPEYVAEKIQEMQEALNLGDLLTWTNMPWIPPKKVLRSIELFGSKVIPKFQARAA